MVIIYITAAPGEAVLANAILQFCINVYSANFNIPLSKAIPGAGPKDGSHNWGGFAHIESYVSYCLGAHFMKFWDPSFGKMQKDIKYP